MEILCHSSKYRKGQGIGFLIGIVHYRVLDNNRYSFI